MNQLDLFKSNSSQQIIHDDCLEVIDGIVLDPFLGSGTTLLAAKNLNINAIGIKLNKDYCEIAENRLKNN